MKDTVVQFLDLINFCYHLTTNTFIVNNIISHTHTHTHTYIYIYIYIYGLLSEFILNI